MCKCAIAFCGHCFTNSSCVMFVLNEHGAILLSTLADIKISINRSPITERKWPHFSAVRNWWVYRPWPLWAVIAVFRESDAHMYPFPVVGPKVSWKKYSKSSLVNQGTALCDVRLMDPQSYFQGFLESVCNILLMCFHLHYIERHCIA